MEPHKFEEKEHFEEGKPETDQTPPEVVAADIKHLKLVTLNGQTYICEFDDKAMDCGRITLKHAVAFSGNLTDVEAKSYWAQRYLGVDHAITANPQTSLVIRNFSLEESLALSNARGLLGIAAQRAPKKVVADYLLSK